MEFNYFSSKIKKHWHYVLLIFIVILFFLGVSSYNFFVQKPSFYWPKKDEFVKWISPDETANYVFSKLYAEEDRLYFYEKYNLIAKDIIHPRSFRSDYGAIKPMSFIGMPILYGKIASVMSYKIIPYLTPFFAALGLIYYYLIIKKIFGKNNALISALILASFPVYIYYSARSMFHNIPFTVFLIMGLYYGIKMTETKRADKKSETAGRRLWFDFFREELSSLDLKSSIYSALGGIFLGIAVGIRSSELLWIGPMMLVMWLFYFKKIGITRLLIFSCFIFIALVPVFYWNQILFGSIFSGGYPEMNQSIQTISKASTGLVSSGAKGNYQEAKNLFNKIESTIFHFGLHPRQSYEIFHNYFIKMFYWVFWPALFGFVLFVIKFWKIKKKQWTYLFSYLILSLILVIYYGSWRFFDNPDKTAITIGNSYTRYWLPVYLGAIPFASFLIIQIASIAKKYKAVNAAIKIAIIAAIYILSIKFVLVGSDEGLVQSAFKNFSSRDEYGKVMKLTENNSVLITGYHDKLFFPERKVIVGDFNDINMDTEYAGLAEMLPVYYYNFTLPKKSVDYLNDRKFANLGLTLSKVRSINNDFALYKLSTSRTGATDAGQEKNK